MENKDNMEWAASPLTTKLWCAPGNAGIATERLSRNQSLVECHAMAADDLAALLSFAQVLAMLGAGPFAQAAGIRNLYYASAAMLLTIAAIGFGILRTQKAT